jgi:hypothetical protein
MFRCPWLYTPRERPLATRLYTRTYGRTYGRRAVETDQPTSLPQDLRLTHPPAAITGPGDDAASDVDTIERVA